MFTGIVRELGRVEAVDGDDAGVRLRIAAPRDGRRGGSRRLGRGQRRLPDRRRRERRNDRLRRRPGDAAAHVARAARGRRCDQRGARPAGRRAPRRPHRAGPCRRGRHRSLARARGAAEPCRRGGDRVRQAAHDRGAARASPLLRREGVDRRRGRQPHGRCAPGRGHRDRARPPHARRDDARGAGSR